MRLAVTLVVGLVLGFGAATWFYDHGGRLVILGRQWGASPSSLDPAPGPGFTTQPPAGFTTAPQPGFTTSPIGSDRSGPLFEIVWPKR
jgi:hypothetical protein